MQISTPELMTDIRNRFAQIDTCPEQGQRIFFENAGGALTLKSVVETSARYAAIPKCLIQNLMHDYNTLRSCA